MDSRKRIPRIPIKQAVELAKIISKQYNITSYNAWKRFFEPTRKQSFLPFKEAKTFVHLLSLKNVQDWKAYCEKNNIPNMPFYPPEYYKNEWISWGDFLGTGHKIPSKFQPFEEARKYVCALKLKSTKEWQKYCMSKEKPDNIPHSPQKIYKEKWIGWNFFLGIGLYRPDLIEGKTLTGDEILSDIEWDIKNLGGMIEWMREESKTDKEILEKYKNEPTNFLKALKEQLKNFPRPEDEE